MSYGAASAGLNASAGHHHNLIQNFQNTSSPDIDLERDLVTPAELLGMETASTPLAADSRFRLNITTIIVSALIFLTILSWFDFIQTTFFLWMYPEYSENTVPSPVKLWYAVFITIFILILIILIYYHSYKYIK